MFNMISESTNLEDDEVHCLIKNVAVFRNQINKIADISGQKNAPLKHAFKETIKALNYLNNELNWKLGVKNNGA